MREAEFVERRVSMSRIRNTKNRMLFAVALAVMCGLLGAVVATAQVGVASLSGVVED
jgi:hypothetical protein